MELVLIKECKKGAQAPFLILGSVDLCGLKFVQSRVYLIAARGL